VQSVRIFAAPKATAAKDVHLAQLVGIVERERVTVWTMDPVHVAGVMRDAARSRWGVDIGAGPEVPLLADRLAIYDRLKSAVATAAAPLVVELAEPQALAFYAASVNAEGVQSPLVPVEVTGIVVPEAKPEEAEAPEEQPAAENPFGDEPEAPAAGEPAVPVEAAP